MPRKNHKSLTEHQKKLVKLITENLGSEGPAKTLERLMLDAGYSPESARQQSNILAGIREELQPIVQEMMDHRTEVIAQMKSKINKAKYRDLTDALDKLTKNIQLLSGGKTASEEIRISWGE